MSPQAAAEAKSVELARRFLRAFGQAVKLVSLYKAGHPVPASSLQEAWHLLQELFAETGRSAATFSLSGGRWLLDDRVVADSAQSYELLAIVFRSHALQSLTFAAGVKPYEFTALCEMASTQPNKAYQTDAADFLRERGVVHIRANMEEHVRLRRARPLASLAIQNPLEALAARRRAPAAAQAAAPSTAPSASQGFGTFVKSLVEQAISDPAERAKVYAEAVRLVEQALARHVSEATHRLLMEKQGMINERLRAEQVLSSVAQGKVIVDPEGRVLMMDPAAESVVGRPLGEVAGKPILESLGTGEEAVSLAQDLVLPENRPVSEEVRTAGPGEVFDALRQSLALVQDEQGRLVGTYAVLPHAAKFRENQRLQEEFIASVTHDLKAPLASICSALELVADKMGKKLAPQESEFLDIGLRNSRLLRQMIDEILDFSKLKSGRMSVKPEPAAVGALLERAREALTPWAKAKGVSLELSEPARVKALPPVLADARRVAQILNNLISNSIKFTPKDGSVTLTAEAGAGDRLGFVVVTVSDTGCGIAAPDQKRLFERFAQGTSADGGPREGVGLGLSIAQELVARHGGAIWFESEAGQGARFHFSLPAAP